MTPEPYLLGYARVSKGDEQSNAAQAAALKKAGCRRVFEEAASGGRWDRPALQEMLRQLRENDVLVVWKLDRLGRSLPHLLELVTRLKERGAGFRSLTEAMDTTTPGGELIFHVMGALAQFERALIVERTRAGMKAARERGRRPGPKPRLTLEQVRHARELIDAGRPVGEVAALFTVSRPTLWRALRRGY